VPKKETSNLRRQEPLCLRDENMAIRDRLTKVEPTLIILRGWERGNLLEKAHLLKRTLNQKGLGSRERLRGCVP